MFKPIVLITSATSRHGRQAANLLLAQGKYIIRLAARDPSQLAGLPAEAIAVDPNSVDSMTRACTGVDFVYLILPSLVRHDAEVAMFHTFLQAALATNIRHVVYLSALDVVPAGNAALLQPIIHHRYEHEQALRSSGIPFTCLRTAAWVQENQVTVHGEAIERTVGGLGSSAGDGDGAWTSAAIADVTKVAAVVMEDPLLHRGRIYTVTTKPVSHSIPFL